MVPTLLEPGTSHVTRHSVNKHQSVGKGFELILSKSDLAQPRTRGVGGTPFPKGG